MKNIFFALCLLSTTACANIAIETNNLTRAIKNIMPWEDICGQSKNAVIQIVTIAKSPDILEPFRSPAQAQWFGSGFFIHPDGYILSNFHVVEKKELCFMQLPALPKERFLLDVIGSCPEKDFALLKLNDPDCEKIKQLLKISQLPYLELGDSDQLAEGQDVMALGYPLGMENFKSSKGIVSGRESTHIGESIQITAAVNHGNSGGPVVDATGKVIGISTMGPAKSESEGIAYIIAINDVITLLPQLNDGKILRLPFWGFEFNPTTEFALSRWQAPIDSGIYLKKIYKSSLFEQAGLQQGDILYSINNNIVDRFGYLSTPERTDKSKLFDYLNRLEIGSTAIIIAYRNGIAKEFNVTVQANPQFKIHTIYPPYEELSPYEVIGGLVVSELSINHINAIINQRYFDPYDNSSEAILNYANYNKLHEERLIISSVLANSPADNTRCFDGSSDIILKNVNGLSVKTIEDFRNAVRKSVGQPSLVIETEGGTIIELSVADIVAEEETLRERNEYYPRSPLIDELEA